MPTISMFFGIIIRMYYAPKEHNPAHIHVYYNEYTATINILSMEIMEGDIPVRQLRLVLAWMETIKKSYWLTGLCAKMEKNRLQ